MHICIICEGNLPESKYSSKDAVICTVCQEKLARVTSVAYGVPQRKTKLHSYLLLISAIRERAECDNLVVDFEANWIYKSPWPVIWGLMGSLDRSDEYKTGDV